MLKIGHYSGGAGRLRFAILGSTRGSILPGLCEAWRAGRFQADPAVVISNRPRAPLLPLARELGLPTEALSRQGHPPEAYDRMLDQRLRVHGIHFIILIGWMRILGGWFVRRWKGRIVNTHPSLLPAYAGLMDLDVHRAVLEAGEIESGCTLHLVDEGVDTGEILIQERCPVYTEDTPFSLKARVQDLETVAFVALLSDPRSYLTAL